MRDSPEDPSGSNEIRINRPIIEAAVLVPVYRGEDGDIRIVLVRRSDGVVHGGELAFPGGKWDSSDGTLLDTALREAQEEIGIAADTVEILEELPSVETITTGFRITPFLGLIVPPEVWKPDEREIAEVLEIRLKDFQKSAVQGAETGRFPDLHEPDRTPFYRIGRHRLWGATFRILHPLISRLEALT